MTTKRHLTATRRGTMWGRGRSRAEQTGPVSGGRSRGRWRPLLLASTVLMAAAACGGDDGATGSGDEGTDAPATSAAGTTGSAGTASVSSGACDANAVLRWGEDLSMRTLDPHQSTTGTDQTYLMTMFDRLTRQMPDGEIVPGLAESWEFSDDLLTLTLHLREGVTFHDGSELTADLVKQNLDRARGETFDKTTFTADLASIAEVAVVDPLTVDVTLSAANTALPAILSDRPGMVIAEASLSDPDVAQNPIGAGPFKFVSYVSGDRLTLEKFGEYWDAENVHLGGLEIVQLPDPTARFNALRSGQIDGTRLDLGDVASAESEPNLVTLAGDTTEMIWMNLNHDYVPELQVAELRQAISHSIDRQALVDTVAHGLATPAVTMFPAGYWAASPNVEVPTPDPAEVQALLEAGGAPDGFTFELFTSSHPSMEGNATVAIQSMLKDNGITLDLETVGDDLSERLYINKESGGVLGPWSGRPDPSQTVSNVYLPTGFVNPADFEVPAMTELAAEAVSATGDARVALYHELDELAAEELIGIGLFSPKTVFAFDESVSGLEVYVQGKYEFRDACVAPKD